MAPVLSFQTADINALSAITNAMKSIQVSNLCIAFDSTALYITDVTASGNIAIFITFDAKGFSKFSATKKGSIAFSADAFARVLRQRANKNGDHDEIRLTYDPAVKSRHGGGVISIEIINSFRDLEQEYQIDLLAVASEPSAAAFDNVDFVSVINDASLFTSFLQSVIQAEGGVMNGSLSIYVNEEEVVLEVPAGVFLRSSRLVLLTSKGMKNKELVGRRATRRIKEGTIKKTFVLQHFCLLAKFFEACSNSTMTLYLKNQPEHFPVVFEGMFGAIGTVKIACVPFVDESLL
jgi:hypothetical protein